MRLLDRYLLRELLIPLAYCICGFLILWIFFDLFVRLNDFQNKKLLPRDIAEYYLVSLPEVLVLVLPIALLLALLYTLTNHARNHEITAIRAAGVSLGRLCVPYLAIGLLGTLVLYVLNEFCVPDSADAADQILYRHDPKRKGELNGKLVRGLGFTNAREGHIWQIGIYNTETGEMSQPNVHWTLPDGTSRWLSADRAVRTNQVWTFYNVMEYKTSLEPNSPPVPVLQTNELAMPQLSETPEEIKSEIKVAGAMSALTSRGTKKADIPILGIRNYLRFHPRLLRTDRLWLHTRLHGRLAAPWTCFVVVLMAIPFGAASGRRNVFVGVASSILICFIYFVVQQFGLALGSGGFVPPWLGAWFPNISFGLVGLWMSIKVR